MVDYKTERIKRITILIVIMVCAIALLYSVNLWAMRTKSVDESTPIETEETQLDRNIEFEPITLDASEETIHLETISDSEMDTDSESTPIESEAEIEFETEPDYSRDAPYESISTEPEYVEYVEPTYYPCGVSLTDEEAIRLAALVQAEADDLYECKTAIASLFINRMIFYNQSFYETLYAPGQFVTAWGTIAYSDPQPDTIQAVYDVLNNGRTIPPYVMFYKIQGYHSWGDQVGWNIIGTTYFSYSYAHRMQIEGSY